MIFSNPLTKAGPVALICCALAQVTQALPDDRYQPITVQADRAIQKNKDDVNTTTYSGNVIITQGSMVINGEKITITSKNGEIQRLIATGSPARFQQQSATDQPPVHARGNTIDYRLTNELVILQEQASIEQDGSVVSGPRIDYNISREQVVAGGTPQERVNIILQPTTKPSPESSNGNTNSK